MTHLVSTRDKLLLLVVKLVAQTVPRSDRLDLNVLVEQLKAEHNFGAYKMSRGSHVYNSRPETWRNVGD